MHCTGIHHFLVEDVRTARRYLSALKIYPSIEALDFQILNKDSKPEDLPAMFAPIFQGINLGVISESGCPGIADPGALATKFAHENEIQVVPLVGPSSILLALMASGLNGQRFAFHGYLPIEAKECAHVIRDLEKESKQKNQTQIFIETPYRNNHLKELLLTNLKNETSLCIALDVTGTEERIQNIFRKKVEEYNFRYAQGTRRFSVFVVLTGILTLAFWFYRNRPKFAGPIFLVIIKIKI